MLVFVSKNIIFYNTEAYIFILSYVYWFQGVTRIFLTKIPFYKDVVIMSFECEHCGFQNNEIQNAGKIEEKGVKIVLQIKSKSDINRQVVKSDHTSVSVPHLEFEIPSQSQKGGK